MVTIAGADSIAKGEHPKRNKLATADSSRIHRGKGKTDDNDTYPSATIFCRIRNECLEDEGSASTAFFCLLLLEHVEHRWRNPMNNRLHFLGFTIAASGSPSIPSRYLTIVTQNGEKRGFQQTAKRFQDDQVRTSSSSFISFGQQHDFRSMKHRVLVSMTPFNRQINN